MSSQEPKENICPYCKGNAPHCDFKKSLSTPKDVIDKSLTSTRIPHTNMDTPELSEKLTFAHNNALTQAEEAVGKAIVNTPEEVAELNKDLPSTLQEQYYHSSLGFVEAVKVAQSIINSLRK